MSASRIITLTLVVVVAAAAAGAWWWAGRADGDMASEPVEDRPRVVLGASKAALSVWIADARHHYDEAGVAVEIRTFDAGKQALTALMAGEVNVATVSDFAFVKKSFTDSSLVVFGAIAELTINRLVARPGSGISKPSDMAGKRVGLTRGTTGEFFLADQLFLHGLSADQVEIVDLPPARLGDALLDGEVDAVLTFEPHVYRVRQRLPEDAVALPFQDGRPFHFLLVARREWLEANQEAARRLLAALIMSERVLEQEPEQSAQIINARFGFDPEYTSYVWADQVFRVSLPQSLLLLMEDQAAWLKGRNRARDIEVPDYLERMDLRPLLAVKPRAVSIVH